MLLLDNATYLRMEFHKALLKRGLSSEKATTMIDELFENAPESKQTNMVNAWRKYKMYSTSRGKNYSYNQCYRYRNK